MNNTQARNLAHINNGEIMVNRSGNPVQAFKLFGTTYSTNKKRGRKVGKAYSFDDEGWEVEPNPTPNIPSIITKLANIYWWKTVIAMK